MPERTPWSALLRDALHFGVQPDMFWRLSLREWRAIAAPRADILPRAAFDALTRHFPDEAT